MNKFCARTSFTVSLFFILYCKGFYNLQHNKCIDNQLGIFPIGLTWLVLTSRFASRLRGSPEVFNNFDQLSCFLFQQSEREQSGGGHHARDPVQKEARTRGKITFPSS